MSYVSPNQPPDEARSVIDFATKTFQQRWTAQSIELHTRAQTDTPDA